MLTQALVRALSGVEGPYLTSTTLTICKVTRIGNRPRNQTFQTFGFHSREIKNRYLLFGLLSVQDESLDNDGLIASYVNYVQQYGCPDLFDDETPSPS